LGQNVNNTSPVRDLPETDENIERVKSMLEAIPASEGRSAWRNVLWALASTCWDCAKDLGAQWSQSCPEKWDAAEFEKIWQTFNPDREGGIGFGTLPHLARQHGWVDASCQDAKAASAELKSLQAPFGAAAVQAARHGWPDTNVKVDWSLKADLRHAKLFADLYRGEFLYVHDRDKWLRWCDGRWHWCTEEEEMEAAKQASIFLTTAAANLIREDQDKASKATREAAEAHKLPRIKAMLELARSEPGMKTSYALLDKNADLLGVSNGVVDLRKGVLLDNAPDRRITRYCEGAYRPDAACPRWLAFLCEVFEGDQDTIHAVQRLLGLTLTGQTSEEVMVFCVGSGANGKSIFGNVVAAIMGDYAVTAPSSLLAARRSDDTAPRSDLAMMAGARLASVNELPCGMKLDETVAKQLAGREPIAARFMYGEFFTFHPTFTPWVRTNHKPIVKGVDEGIWRRLIILRFCRTFAPKEQDPKLEQALLAERDGILGWMVCGAKLYLTSGLRRSPAMTREVADYRDASDVLGEFLSTCTEDKATHKAEQSYLYSVWKMWCETNGHHPGAKATFTERLAERGYRTAKSGPKRHYVGLKVVNPLASR
jgi:putative DNA primase/helicase